MVYAIIDPCIVFFGRFAPCAKKKLWGGLDKDQDFPWTVWKFIAWPKILGGWGIKDLPSFAKSLAAKSVWCVISDAGLWNIIIHYKYIAPLSINEWIRSTDKHLPNSSIMWKAITKSFHLVGYWLAWKIGKGRSV